MPDWYDSRFTGLFTLFVRPELRAHDPAVPIAAGEMPAWSADEPELGCSGAGWSTEQADRACVGEAVERLLARMLPCDRMVTASWSAWPVNEPAVPPERWVLFHDEQYAAEGFPFAPLTPQTVCRWVCCRQANTGSAVWVPEELVSLVPRSGERPQIAFGFSTGLSCGRSGDDVLLRGVQEVIERDALIGAWWGRYRVEEHPVDDVAALIGRTLWDRVDRPNLVYRCYRVQTPFSSHVTMISLSGRDEEGWVFCVGTACRETRRESWLKSLLEAVQGRHCVRRLLANWSADGSPPLEVPTTFFQHALYYSLHRDRLQETVLEHASAPAADDEADCCERLAALCQRLGPERPILFRVLTPPGLAEQLPDWVVLRVLIPGLQPLHGDHRLPFLGGPLWQPRTLADWPSIPPHPFA